MLVPKLRFKREDGTDFPEWIALTLGERFTFKNGINASREAFRAEGVHCIGVSDVCKCLPIAAESIIGTVAVSDDEIEKSKVNYGDILFQRSSETREDIGHASVYFDNVPSVYNGFVICAKPDELFYDPLYIHYSLQNTRVRKQTITLGAGSGQHYNIGQEGLAQIKAVFPCLEEQAKIADLIYSIDEVIAQSEAEVQNLEQQKKAAMQKIFSQEVRFKREDGTDYPEWEAVSFGSLIKEYRHRTSVENEDVLLSSAINGIFLNTELFGHQRGKSNIGYLKIDYGTLILSAQNLHLGNANVNLRFEHGIISPAYKTYHITDCNVFFMAQWIKREETNQFFYDATTVGASQCRRNVDWNALYEQRILLPHIEEQQKIADFLSGYDEAISYAKQELDKWKELKKGLLQQMFV